MITISTQGISANTRLWTGSVAGGFSRICSHMVMPGRIGSTPMASIAGGWKGRKPNRLTGVSGSWRGRGSRARTAGAAYSTASSSPVEGEDRDLEQDRQGAGHRVGAFLLVELEHLLLSLARSVLWRSWSASSSAAGRGIAAIDLNCFWAIGNRISQDDHGQQDDGDAEIADQGESQFSSA